MSCDITISASFNRSIHIMTCHANLLLCVLNNVYDKITDRSRFLIDVLISLKIKIVQITVHRDVYCSFCDRII